MSGKQQNATFTPRQKVAIAAAPPAKKDALRRAYRLQSRATPKKTAQKPKKQPQPPLMTQKLRIPKPKFDLFDPMHSIPVPTMMSEGKAFPMTGKATGTFQVSDKPVVLIVGNTGLSGTVGYLRITETDYTMPSSSSSEKLFNVPVLDHNHEMGGPSAGRAMKLGVSVCNTSNAYKRGGAVYYLNSSQRLPGYNLPPGTGSYSMEQVVDSVIAHPSTKRTSGAELGAPKQLISHPVDNTAYHTYSPWQGNLDRSAFLLHHANPTNVFGPSSGEQQGSSSDGLAENHTTAELQRPMTTIVYIFMPTGDVQDYSVTIRAAFYTRWPLHSAPGQAMKNTPTAPPHVINRHVDIAEQTANDEKPLDGPKPDYSHSGDGGYM